MVKVDLDELERKARAATHGEWAADRVPGTLDRDQPVMANVIALDLDDTGRQQQIADCYDNTRCPDQQCEANAALISAACPPVVIALIERIRELENAVRESVDHRWAGQVADAADNALRRSWITLIEEGVVLP